MAEVTDVGITAGVPDSGTGTVPTLSKTNTLLGAVNEAAPASDTASSGVNGRLQRIAQNLTSAAVDSALFGAVTETAPATDTASSGLNGRLQRIAQRLTSLLTTATAALASTVTALNVRFARDLLNKFDLVSSPTTTNGAYSAGDIVGGLITLAVASEAAQPVTIDSIQVIFKDAVQPNLRIKIFSADPSATTKTDNAAYTLNSADVLKVVDTVLLGGSYANEGTAKSIRVNNLGIDFVSADTNAHFLVVDDTGVTLASTSGMQFRVAGKRNA